mmetsp:Transcript_513/g.1852  ORF Transcript_513/g.1852 Transcript_513/m.1852 type:complete len:234 (-) Transcript_513:570-1271(-)
MAARARRCRPARRPILRGVQRFATAFADGRRQRSRARRRWIGAPRLHPRRPLVLRHARARRRRAHVLRDERPRLRSNNRRHRRRRRRARARPGGRGRGRGRGRDLCAAASGAASVDATRARPGWTHTRRPPTALDARRHAAGALGGRLCRAAEPAADVAQLRPPHGPARRHRRRRRWIRRRLVLDLLRRRIAAGDSTRARRGIASGHRRGAERRRQRRLARSEWRNRLFGRRR